MAGYIGRSQGVVQVNTTAETVSDKPNSSTGFFSLPTGTTAQRPGSPAVGYSRMNTTTGSLEFYDGTNWISTNLIPTINSVTGTIYAGAASTLTFNLANATDTVTARFSEGGVTIADVTNVTVSAGSASVTVPSAVFNQTAGDTIAVSIFNSDGTPSSNSISKTVQALPTGGTITTVGSYRVHLFTSSGTLAVPSGFSLTAEYFAVAGGGGGGVLGGGGGAGGVLTGSTAISQNNYSIVVGGGGTNGSPGNRGSNGTNTTLFGLTCIGGGGGGSHDNGSVGVSGASGGSGGGGSDNTGQGYGPGSGTSGQGFAGGNGTNIFSDTLRGGGGGGGASEAGKPFTDTSGGRGRGGNGVSNDWLGTSYAFAGGGGRSSYGVSGGAAGNGGLGGGGGGSAADDAGPAGTGGAGYNSGGNGQTTSSGSPGGNGGANTGGGAGANGWNFSAGAAGGSGVVIIRYAL